MINTRGAGRLIAAATALFLLGGCSTELQADDGITGFQTLLAEKLKEAKPVALITLKASPGGAAFLPIYTIHASYADGKFNPMLDYVEIGAGYKGQQGQKPGGYFALDFNIVGLSRRLFSGEWAQGHISSSKFPPIFIGPAVMLPMDLHRIANWNPGDDLGAQASVRF